jgi:ribonuclease P protein component
MQHPLQAPRLGITASRRVGGAVARNRVRRRLRAAGRELLPKLAAVPGDYVLIGRAATLTRPFPALLADLTAALRRLHAVRAGAEVETDAAAARRG